MKLIEFVSNYIDSNSIVRLLYKDKNGHRTVLNSWSDVDMCHRLSKGIGLYSMYKNHEFLSVCSISSKSYPDAINIVIDEIPIDELRQQTIDYLLEY